MRRPALPAVAITALLFAALAAPVTPPPATAATVAATGAAASLSPPAQAPVAGAQQAPAAGASLLLINGDRVLSGAVPGARTAAIVPAPGGGPAASLTELRSGGKTLLIPLVALPYLGHGLDPSLFDLTALRHAERNGHLPVTIRYLGRRPALPGVTLTHTGTQRRDAGGPAWATADGYLTSSSAARFGAALARQLVTGHGRASYGTHGPFAGGLFAGGLSVSLAGARPSPAHAPDAGPAPGQPSQPTHTLTVTGTNSSGQPDTGDVVTVINVNDPTAVDKFRFFNHGTATFHVPAGTYWAIGQFLQILNHGRSGVVRQDVLPQFTVTDNTAEHVSAQAATSKLAVVTPRPAVPQFTMFSVYRFGPHGPCTGNVCLAGPEYAFLGFGALTYSVNPVSHQPTDGILRAYVNAELASPRTLPGRPYVYALNLAGPPGLITVQHYAVHAAGLATAAEQYAQDKSSTGDWGGCAGTLFQLKQFVIFCGEVPFRLPEVRTMYLSARPVTYWQLGYFSDQNLNGGQQDSARLPRPGQTFTENWNAYPLHPSPDVSLPGADPGSSVPSAARIQNLLVLDITPFSDNQPGHTGAGFSGGFGKLTGTYRLDDNGQKIAGGNAVHTAGGAPNLLVQATLRPQPSRIRFVLNASWQARLFRLSGASHDVWTWRTHRQPGATVPRQWFCIAATSRVTRHCAVQPMMALRYQVTGLSLEGSTAPGRQTVGITVSHLQLAASPPVTHTQLQVSFDNGKTWHNTTVHRLGPAQFRATFTAPASHGVSLRVVARDAAGNSIAETIRNGYQTSA